MNPTRLTNSVGWAVICFLVLPLVYGMSFVAHSIWKPNTHPVGLALASDLSPVTVAVTVLAAVVIASEKHPLTALTFAEILATSDLPGGVVNILTGRRTELALHIATHMDVNAIVDGTGLAELGAALQAGTAKNLKRYSANALSPAEWFSSKGEDPYKILDTVEFKTAWHPIGI